MIRIYLNVPFDNRVSFTSDFRAKTILPKIDNLLDLKVVVILY